MIVKIEYIKGLRKLVNYIEEVVDIEVNTENIIMVTSKYNIKIPQKDIKEYKVFLNSGEEVQLDFKGYLCYNMGTLKEVRVTFGNS